MSAGVAGAGKAGNQASGEPAVSQRPAASGQR